MPGEIADVALKSNTAFEVIFIMLLLLLPTPCEFHMTLTLSLNIVYGVQKTTESPIYSAGIDSNKNRHKTLYCKNQSSRHTLKIF